MNLIIRWWFRKELQRLDDVVKVCNERGDIKYCGWSDEAWFAYETGIRHTLHVLLRIKYKE